MYYINKFIRFINLLQYIILLKIINFTYLLAVDNFSLLTVSQLPTNNIRMHFTFYLYYWFISY